MCECVYVCVCVCMCACARACARAVAHLGIASAQLPCLPACTHAHVCPSCARVRVWECGCVSENCQRVYFLPRAAVERVMGGVMDAWVECTPGQLGHMPDTMAVQCMDAVLQCTAALLDRLPPDAQGDHPENTSRRC